MTIAFTKTVFATIGFAAAFSSAALAGDFASLNVLGFSSDGATFAFEEYGVQDGSGFPYANRYYIDTSTDQFIGGSPIRVRIDDETASVSDARNDAKTRSEAIIADNDLMAAYAAGLNTVTETSADPFRMAVNPRPVVPPIDKEIEFRLAERQFAPIGTCDGIQDISVGFELNMIGLNPGDMAKVLHEDASVPASRGCPDGYRIGGVYTYFPQGGDPVYAVTIAIRSFGFEGPDYRWLAITTRAAAAPQP